MLVGQKEVGKTTFVKQVHKIYNNQHLPISECKARVHAYILRTTIMLLHSADVQNVKASGYHAQQIQNQIQSMDLELYIHVDKIWSQLAQDILTLWNDPKLRELSEHINLDLNCNIFYFLHNMEMFGNNYNPDEKDALYSYFRGTNATEVTVKLGSGIWTCSDLAALRGERKKFLPVSSFFLLFLSE